MARHVQEVIGLMQKNLECAICLELLKNPVSTKCDHQFCKFCITQFLQNKRSVPCPLCKKPVTKRTLNDRTELGEIVENVRKLITAYQEDTGSIFSPPNGPDVVSFFPCTPEPLPNKNTRGTKRKTALIEPLNVGHKRKHVARSSKHIKPVPGKDEDTSDVTQGENSAEDAIVMLDNNGVHGDLLNYLENGSCGAKNSSQSDLTTNELTNRHVVTKRRTRSADKNVSKENDNEICNHDNSQGQANVLVLEDYTNKDNHFDDVEFHQEVCDETADAKKMHVRNVKKTTLNKVNDHGVCEISEKIVNEKEDGHRTRNTSRKRNEKIDKEFDEENSMVGVGLESQNEKQFNLFSDDIFDREKENISRTDKEPSRTLRERKNVKSLKELTDSFDESGDKNVHVNSQQLSESSGKSCISDGLFNTQVAKVDRTYSRKDIGQGTGQEKNKGHRVKEWLQNLPENNGGQNVSSTQTLTAKDQVISENSTTTLKNELSEASMGEEIKGDVSSKGKSEKGEELQLIVPQRKRIFKTTRDPSQHHQHDMTISQCKGNLSFKMVSSEILKKSNNTQKLARKRTFNNKIQEVKHSAFIWDEDENNVCKASDNSDKSKHLNDQDVGEDSDPYEFKSSQKTPKREKRKLNKSKVKSGVKKTALEVKFVDQVKKGDKNNPVEIIDDGNDDETNIIPDSANVSARGVTDLNVEATELEVGKGETSSKTEDIISVGTQKAGKKTKKQKSPKGALTQKDFDDLEKLKDKISDAEDYDLLMSTQEATDKMSIAMESENPLDVIPDTEYSQGSEGHKAKKKVSFCNVVIKHAHGSDISVSKVEKDKLNKETDTEKTNSNPVKILKKIDSPKPVTVIGETQSQVSIPGSKANTTACDKKSIDIDKTFKHPGNIVTTSKQNKDNIKRIPKMAEIPKIVDANGEPTNGVELESELVEHVDEDIESCSSGTDDLNVDPSQEEFEDPDLEIQPDHIRETLSQDLHSEEYKTVKPHSVVTSIQETPQIQINRDSSQPKSSKNAQRTDTDVSLEKSECLSAQPQSRSRKGLTRKKKKSEINIVSVVQETPVVTMATSCSVVQATPIAQVTTLIQETPAVAKETPSVFMVSETQITAELPETPNPSSLDKFEPAKSLSSVSSSLETVIGDTQSLPNFVVEQMQNKTDKVKERSNIEVTNKNTSGDLVSDDTQQSVSLLILPTDNKIDSEDKDECITISEDISENETKTKLSDMEKNNKILDILSGEGDGVSFSESVLKTKRNKLKKRKSRSPGSSGFESTQLGNQGENDGKCLLDTSSKQQLEKVEKLEKPQTGVEDTDLKDSQKRGRVGRKQESTEYIPSTEGASRENTQIIKVQNLQIESEESCQFISSENTRNNVHIEASGKLQEQVEADNKRSEKSISAVHKKGFKDGSQKMDLCDSEVLTKVDIIDESAPDELTPTLVSLKTVRKLEKSHSKLNHSPDDIFMLDSETPPTFDEDLDEELPQNQEGVCFLESANFDSEMIVKPSQSVEPAELGDGNKKNIKRSDDEEVHEIQHDDTTEIKEDESAVSKVNSGINFEVERDVKNDINEINEQMETEDVHTLVSDSKRTNFEKIDKGGYLVDEDEVENIKVKVRSKTRRGLAHRIKRPTQGSSQRSTLMSNNDSTQSVPESLSCADNENPCSNLKKLDDEVDIENLSVHENKEVNNINTGGLEKLKEKVSPTFSYSPRKGKNTPSKISTPVCSQTSENGEKMFATKRTSLTFTKHAKRFKKSGVNQIESQADENLTQTRRSSRQQGSVSIIPDSLSEENVLSLSQSSYQRKASGSVKKPRHSVNNKLVADQDVSEKKLHTVNDNAKKSKDVEKIKDVSVCLEKLSQDSVEGKLPKKKKMGPVDNDTSDADSIKGKLPKKKKVRPVESDTSDDDLFDRSSPLPDVLHVEMSENENLESSKRIPESESSDDDDAVLIRRDSEQAVPEIMLNEETCLVDESSKGHEMKVPEWEELTDKNKKNGNSREPDYLVTQTSAQVISDEEDGTSLKKTQPMKTKNEKKDTNHIELNMVDESDDSGQIVRSHTSKSKKTIIEDDSESDDSSSQESSQQMNLTSSSAFSSQSEAMTSQQKEELEKDLERMKKHILELEAQLSATKHSDSKKLNRSRKSKSPDSSDNEGSIKKKSSRRKRVVRRISSESSDECEHDLKDKLDNVIQSSEKVTTVIESDDENLEKDIHQYPSSGDESDELFLSPLPPSPPPSQVQINIQINLPEKVKQTDEFLKQIIGQGQSSDNEPSSPILSQSKVTTFDFSTKEQENFKNSNRAMKDSHHSSPLVFKNEELQKDKYSSPFVTKMNLKNSQHSTPIRTEKGIGKIEKFQSPMFQNSQLAQVSNSRPALSPIVSNNEIKEERWCRNKCFVSSNLSIEEMKELQKLAILNDCKFHTKFSTAVTHVIVRTQPVGSRVCDRTLKFFQGLANKCWILDYQWVIDSRGAGYLLPEENYEIKGDTVTTDDHNGPRRVRLSKKPLFKGLQICIIHTSEGLTPDNLAELFTACSGEVVADPSQFSDNCTGLIITCTDYDEENPTDEEIKIFNKYYRQYRTLTLTREWVLDSLTLNTLQPLEDYVLTCVKGMTIPEI